MKGFMLSAILALFAVCSLQAQQGSMYIGGGLGYDETTWRFAPEVGTWIADDLQLGLVATLYGQDGDGNIKFGAAPHLYLRKWFSVSDRFSLFAGANVQFSTESYRFGESSTNFNGFLDAGFGYSVAPRWGMVGRFGRLGYINEAINIDLNLSPGSLFNIGLYYTFKE